jgi:hypothetical protein
MRRLPLLGRGQKRSKRAQNHNRANNLAKSELTFSTPIFANIAVSAANTADRSAHNCHDQDTDPFGFPIALEAAALTSVVLAIDMTISSKARQIEIDRGREEMLHEVIENDRQHHLRMIGQ